VLTPPAALTPTANLIAEVKLTIRIDMLQVLVERSQGLARRDACAIHTACLTS